MIVAALPQLTPPSGTRVPDDPLLVVRDLSVGWGGTPILEHVDFEVRRGEVFVILGGSGCGKSTVLRHIVGLQAPMAGRIDTPGLPDAGRAVLGDAAPPFGFMFQAGALFGSRTLLQNVCVPLLAWTNLPADAMEAVARARLAEVGLAGFEHHMPSEISGGMRKRAAIARALALDPPLLVLDEPSAGLDPVTSAELDHTIVGISRRLGATIIVVTHELPSIFAIADRCVMLDREARGVVAKGDPRVMRDTSTLPIVKRFFLRESPGDLP
jgi:phospholipid/cholesterol/gamma-HCH transport system ATP-binding protein